jgi:murein DD-endopeptidase MepM/ murein hydrolase activator NlpD
MEFRVEHKYGDVNGDGKINSTDSLRVQQYAGGDTGAIASEYLRYADVDANGGVDGEDAELILQYAANTLKVFPAEPGALTATVTNAKISADKSKIKVGEEITFTFSADYAVRYSLEINRGDTRIATPNINGAGRRKHTTSFDTPGNYSVYVTGLNDAARSKTGDSAPVAFTVESEKEKPVSEGGSSTSENGIAFLKEREGFEPLSYWDNGQWSIGYGSGVKLSDYPNGITEAEADALLRRILPRYEGYLNSFLDRYGIKPTQNQYDALVSFTYNLGNVWSDAYLRNHPEVGNANMDGDFSLRYYLRTGINNYSASQIKTAFTNWDSNIKGVYDRRALEAELFLNGTAKTAPDKPADDAGAYSVYVSAQTTVYAAPSRQIAIGSVRAESVDVLWYIDGYAYIRYDYLSGGAKKCGFVPGASVGNAKAQHDNQEIYCSMTAKSKTFVFADPVSDVYINTDNNRDRSYITQGENVTVYNLYATTLKRYYISYDTSSGKKFGWCPGDNLTGQDDSAASDTTGWQFPLAGAYCSWTDGGADWSWGAINYNKPPDRHHHNALDLNGSNYSVMAAASGKVSAVGYSSANGNYIIIESTVSGKTVYQFYAHLASYNVAKGDSVAKGQKIGVVGTSGGVGKHLHFAIADDLWSKGSYYGYTPPFSGNSVRYEGVTYYNPKYVIENGRLP